MRNKTAQGKSLKITILYFIIGCAWILLSDKLVQLNFSGQNQVLFYSMAKGILYVIVTSILIYGLTYPPLKEALDGKEALRKANVELLKTNELYKELNQDYSKKQALLQSLVDSIPDLIFYKDTNSVYLGCNKAFESFAGKLEQDIVGRTDRDLFPPGEAELFINMDIDMLSKNMFRKNEETVTYPDGREVVLETLKTPYHDSKGTIIGLIGISRDITERKKREEKVRYISYHDALTGIYNRAYFDEARIALDSPEQLPLSVIIGNVNGMKLINDAFGHVKGDKLLQETASILKQCFREEDIVARTGGDEFSILMPHADGQTVKGVVDRIRALCKEKRHEENNDIYIDIALGYATKSEPSDSLEKAILLAQDLMYRRKLLENKSLHNDYLLYIKTTMFEKSNETEEHAERLAKVAKRLGEEMGLSEDALDELELVAMLHDIGKISVDKNILTKEGELSKADWEEIKKHPEVGFRIANSTSELSHIAEYILCHHEHWDGSGYPLGLSGTNIPLISRIITVVDAYDAMTQDRAYRKALPPDVAVKEILRNRGTQFEPKIVDIFVKKVLLESLE
jgi:diguanylate cyclase (GGDEF)-like protein/PAS domain S-box-containing protein